MKERSLAPWRITVPCGGSGRLWDEQLVVHVVPRFDTRISMIERARLPDEDG